jgi:hypothetical protein
MWASAGSLQKHFRDHQRDVGVGTVEESDRSARQTFVLGKRFTYDAPWVGVHRVGYYAVGSNRFTALDETETELVTHFCPTDGEQYVRCLPNSTYQ